MGNKDKLLCASLIRYSSSKQRKGHSKETQSRRNKYTIEHVIGGKFVEEFVDDAISGFHNNFHKRTGMLGLIKSICEGKVNCVVFYDESRFSRRIIDFFREFLAPIREANPNVKFFRSIDIDETGGKEWNPEDPEAKRNFILAYKESAKKQVYALTGLDLKLSKGERPGSRLPYGIGQITQDEIIPNEDIAVVLLIFELASWGYSESNIAGILSDLKIETRFFNSFEEGIDSEVDKFKWNPSSVHYIINNPIYIGKLYWNRRESIYNSTPKPIDQQRKFAEYDPVIPVELWTLAHEEMERKSNGTKMGKIRMKTNYMLSDIISCKECGCLMKTKNRSKRNSPKRKTKKGNPLIYYYCPQCSMKVDSSELDQMILNQIKTIIFNQFNPLNVTDKINEWVTVIKKEKIKKEKQLIEEKMNKSSEKMKRLLRQGEYDLYLKIQDEYITILESEVIDLNRSLDELLSLKNSDVITRLRNRFSILDTEASNIEIRYILFKCIDSLKVSLNKDEDIKIDLMLRNLPLPLLQQKLEDQIS